jgi:PAS domain S-box-containing protein
MDCSGENMSLNKKNSILIVDDNNADILQLTHILKSEYIIYAAIDGQSAIEAAKKYHPDIILLDIVMPGMDGYSVINVLKEFENTKNIPIICISGLSSTEDEEKGLNYGIADYISKPFSAAIVKLRVKNQMKLINEFRINEYDIMKYKLANDALNITMWDMDIVSDDLVNPKNKFTWSQEFRNMLGFSDENDFPNLLGSWSDRLHPDDKENVINAFTAHINDRTNQTPYNVEYRLLMKNEKEYRYFQALGATQRDYTGMPLRIAGSLMDITEKKQMEEKTREEEERMKLLLEAMPLACTLINRRHRLIYINQEAIDLFGESEKEDLTEKYLEIMPEFQPCGRRTLEFVQEQIEKAFNDGYARFELTYQYIGTGELIPCESTAIRIKHRNEYILAAYARDLREQKAVIEEMRKAEVAEESNRAKSQFLANMSHEMRTPMNVVVGLTGLMLEEDDPTVNLEDNLKKISTAGNALLGLINDVLDISKIEAGRLELMPVNYEIPSLLNDIITLNIARFEDKPITFVLDIDENLPFNLFGDDLRIKQIINNVLSNAFKYTQEGTVTLGVSCEPDNASKEKVWVSIYISDTGIGIRKEDLDKLFTDYGQVDTRTNRMIEGTGLGLAITKRLTEMMDGGISVESKYGIGSIFRLRFSQGYVNDIKIGKEIAERLCDFRYSEEKHGKGKKFIRSDLSYAKVLVVDDMQTNLDVAAGLLGKYKMQVDCVLSGQEAVERIRSGTQVPPAAPIYNAIFMDHMMPGMDGIEAVKIIRGIDSEYACLVPIIALTANAIQGTENLFLANGFQAFIPKPIDVMQLDSVIRKWITS